MRLSLRVLVERFGHSSLGFILRTKLGTINSESNRYNCTYALLLFLSANCCKKLKLTLLTLKSLKHTIVGIRGGQFSQNVMRYSVLRYWAMGNYSIAIFPKTAVFGKKKYCKRLARY